MEMWEGEKRMVVKDVQVYCIKVMYTRLYIGHVHMRLMPWSMKGHVHMRLCKGHVHMRSHESNSSLFQAQVYPFSQALYYFNASL